MGGREGGREGIELSSPVIDGLKKAMSGLPSFIEAESIEWWFSIREILPKMLMLKVID